MTCATFGVGLVLGPSVRLSRGLYFVFAFLSHGLFFSQHDPPQSSASEGSAGFVSENYLLLPGCAGIPEKRLCIGAVVFFTTHAHCMLGSSLRLSRGLCFASALL